MSKQEIEPLSVQRCLGLILLSTALVLIPSIITSKRINVSVPKPSIALGRLEPTAEATSIQDMLVDKPVEEPQPVNIPQTVQEPPQAPVVPKTIVTPPPVEKPITAPPKPIVEQPKPAITGTKQEWLAASNIPRKDWELVDWLVSRESSWNPSAQNPRSTAFGLKQFLDGTWAGVGCTKAEAIGNPVYQLNCGHQYVLNRYNSWEGAVGFWRAHHWY